MATPDHIVARMAAVQARIQDHPLSSEPVRDAFEVIERHGKENSDAITRELTERGLPSLDELGRLQIRYMFSWWRLNRRKRILERRMLSEP
ncbi:hypothetical protein [uncultured Microbacterium sp.]|uniref:hypothetical protein n=1 Tax=uncultured Microbacterium sp. TaxID=191216 RepID=UPI0028D25D2C|nr:hypothetical protein [uncultured Microbacterium sp.]